VFNIVSSCLFLVAWKVLVNISKRVTDPELHGLMKHEGKLMALSVQVGDPFTQ
jgi:hypothetical protein